MAADYLTEIKNIFDGGSLVLSVSVKDYSDMLAKLLDFLVNKNNFSGVVLAVNKPYAIIKKDLEKNNIDWKKVLVIDTVSSTLEKREANCIYLPRPFNANLANMALDEFVSDPEQKFFVFDTLDSILATDAKVTVKFFQFILPQISTKNKFAIVIGVGLDLAKQEIKLISQLANKIVEV